MNVIDEMRKFKTLQKVVHIITLGFKWLMQPLEFVQFMALYTLLWSGNNING
jgi:hypothetical protein